MSADIARFPSILRCLPRILFRPTRVLRKHIDHLYRQYCDWYRVSWSSIDGAARQTLPCVSTLYGMAWLVDLCCCTSRGLFRRHYRGSDHDTRCHVRRFVLLETIPSFAHSILIIQQSGILFSSIHSSAWSMSGGSADAGSPGASCWLLPVRQDWPTRSSTKSCFTSTGIRLL